MSPEVVLREWHSYPADIWSLGCLVIEMASGSPPWSNYSDLSREVLKLIAKPNNLPDIPKVSPVLSDFILQCLERDPSKRPSAKELLNHQFIMMKIHDKCYESIRTSNNVISLKSYNEDIWEKKNL